MRVEKLQNHAIVLTQLLYVIKLICLSNLGGYRVLHLTRNYMGVMT